MKIADQIMLLSAFAIFMSCSPQYALSQDKTVSSLDINRYMGKWYEIARFDHIFERGLNYVTAEYRLKDDGTIEVINSGVKDGNDVKRHIATGRAKQPNADDPGKLKVSFFLWFYADYNILVLAEDYSYALIGSSSDKYLWILSRTPQLSDDVRIKLLDEARNRGYDTSKLIWVKQQR